MRKDTRLTQNWRGRPLVSLEVTVNLIGTTTTRAGLQVQAQLDRAAYRTGIKVTVPTLTEAAMLSGSDPRRRAMISTALANTHDAWP